MPDDLFRIANEQGILVEFCEFPPNGLGFYSRTYTPPVILLSKLLKKNRLLLRVILAEELGHHFTGAVISGACSNITSTQQLKNKIEKKALWWAACQLVPFDNLVATLNENDFLLHELAENLNITERFLETSIRLYYQKKGDLMIKKLNRLPEELNSN